MSSPLEMLLTWIQVPYHISVFKLWVQTLPMFYMSNHVQYLHFLHSPLSQLPGSMTFT